MKGHLRDLLDAAPTSPSDPFTWKDKRPIIEQVASGLRKAGGLIAGFLVITMAFGGVLTLSDRQATNRISAPVAWAAIFLAAIVMLLTANRWAPWVAGFFFGPALLKLAVALAFQPDTYYASHSLSRWQLAGFLLYSVAVVLLTWRFVGKHPDPTTLLDRLALTFFAFASFAQVVTPYRFPPWPLLSGAAALLAAWAASRFAHRKHRRRHRRS